MSSYITGQRRSELRGLEHPGRTRPHLGHGVHHTTTVPALQLYISVPPRCKERSNITRLLTSFSWGGGVIFARDFLGIFVEMLQFSSMLQGSRNGFFIFGTFEFKF